MSEQLAARNARNSSADGQQVDEEESNKIDRSLPRLRTVDGVERDALPRVHGALIAWGFLKFSLPSRTGVRYEVTGLGREAVLEPDQRKRETDDELKLDAA